MRHPCFFYCITWHFSLQHLMPQYLFTPSAAPGKLIRSLLSANSKKTLKKTFFYLILLLFGIIVYDEMITERNNNGRKKMEDVMQQY